MFCDYERSSNNSGKLTGNILLKIRNNETRNQTIIVTDNSYKAPPLTKSFAAKGAGGNFRIPLGKNNGWYDFTVSIKGNSSFKKRYAGHVETGAGSKTDPAMGKLI